MRWLALATLSSLLPSALSLAASEPLRIVQSFVMNVAENGKPQTDYFEVWDTTCVLRSEVPARPSCAINSVSLVENERRTHVHTWRHDADAISEVAPGVFRVEMNGRSSDCSGLQVIVRVDGAGRVSSIEGEIRVGSQCQSRRTMSLDTASPTRAIAPIWNSAFRWDRARQP
jgi:hypothetical protein